MVVDADAYIKVRRGAPRARNAATAVKGMSEGY